MPLNEKILHTSIDEWPSEWNELLVFLDPPLETAMEESFWKELVTTYVSTEQLDESSTESYKEYFKNFWVDMRPDLLESDDKVIIAAGEGYNVYINNLIKNVSRDDRSNLLEQKNQSGDTALHVAIKYKHPVTAEILIDLGLDINAKGDQGMTPLHVAAYRDDVILLRHLLERGAICSKLRSDGEMPIHVAVNAGAIKFVDELIKQKPEQLSAIGREGRTPFIRAIIDNNISIVDVLLQHGADINQINPKSWHGALHIAAQKNRPIMIKHLIDNGAKIDLLSSNGLTALAYCIKQDPPSVAAAKILLESGADLNAGDPTPLALFNEYYDVESQKYNELKELFQAHGVTFGADGHVVTFTK